MGVLLSIVTWIFSNAIKPFTSLFTAFLTAQTTSEKTQASVINQASQTQGIVAAAIYNHWWATLPIVVVNIPGGFYLFKSVVYDDCLQLGSTPELHGQVADLVNAAFYCLTGYGGVLGSAALIVSGFGRK